MSKSKNNVVEPRDIIARFGADTGARVVMFAGPPDRAPPWSSSSADGVYRFLRRLWTFGYEHASRSHKLVQWNTLRFPASEKR